MDVTTPVELASVRRGRWVRPVLLHLEAGGPRHLGRWRPAGAAACACRASRLRQEAYCALGDQLTPFLMRLPERQWQLFCATAGDVTNAIPDGATKVVDAGREVGDASTTQF